MEIKSLQKRLRKSQILEFYIKALTHKLSEVRCEVEK